MQSQPDRKEVALRKKLVAGTWRFGNGTRNASEQVVVRPRTLDMCELAHIGAECLDCSSRGIIAHGNAFRSRERRETQATLARPSGKVNMLEAVIKGKRLEIKKLLTDYHFFVLLKVNLFEPLELLGGNGPSHAKADDIAPLLPRVFRPAVRGTQACRMICVATAAQHAFRGVYLKVGFIIFEHLPEVRLGVVSSFVLTPVPDVAIHVKKSEIVWPQTAARMDAATAVRHVPAIPRQQLV